MNGEIEGGVTYSSRGRGTVSEDADVSVVRDSNTSVDPHEVPGARGRAPSVPLLTFSAHFLRRYAIFLVLAALIVLFQSR